MAKQGYVYFRDGLDTAGRDSFLDQLSGLAYVIHANPSQIRFESWPVAELDNRGQAFGPQAEARWWPGAKGGWEMQVLSESALNLPGWQLTSMEVDDETSQFLLWGRHWHDLEGASQKENLPPGWVAAQVEATLYYPIPDGQQWPTVAVKGYIYRQNGQARLTRFAVLEEAKVPQKGGEEAGDGI